MLSAVAVGKVVQGDKEAPEKTDMNEPITLLREVCCLPPPSATSAGRLFDVTDLRS